MAYTRFFRVALGRRSRPTSLVVNRRDKRSFRRWMRRRGRQETKEQL